MKKFLASCLCFVLAFGAPMPSFAGYAQLKPPPGWSQGTVIAAGQTGVFNFGVAGNAASFKGTTVLTNAALTVAGQLVTVPMSMRVAANAATVAATYSFGNPLLFAAALALPFAYDWYKEQGFEVRQGIWTVKDTSIDVNYEFSYAGNPWTTARVAADQGIAVRNAGPRTGAYNVHTFKRIEFTAPNAYATVVTSRDFYNETYQFTDEQTFSLDVRKKETTTIIYRPATKEEFVNKMKPLPIGDKIPLELPQIDWPVQTPVFNPDPLIVPRPAPNPVAVPRPMWIPTGDPVKNPNPDRNPDGTVKPLPDGTVNPNPKPDTWTQPGTRVIPSPTPTDPWRVDLQPDDRTRTSPLPNTDQPIVTTTPQPAPPAKIEIETCGLPGKPKCQIDELDTKTDKGTTYDQPKADMDTQKDAAKSEIDKAANIQAPSWTFAFNLPTGCAPFPTGLRGVVIDMCAYQSTIHNLLSMIWAGTTVFTLIGMVGRTIRES